MFDSSALKGMKLSELQEIAKLAKTIKFNGVKKEVLIEQILAHQEATSKQADASSSAPVKEEKVKRARISPAGAVKPETNSADLFTEAPIKNERFQKKTFQSESKA
jgi:transcription termination factor Rho